VGDDETLESRIREQLTAFHPKCHQRLWCKDRLRYERPTLELMHADLQISKLIPHCILYLHSKGVTRGGNPRITEWRRLMMHYLVTHYRLCLECMYHCGFEAVGTLFHTIPSVHFSGNFWWAQSWYVYHLPPTIGTGYADTEFWIGQHGSYFASLKDETCLLYDKDVHPSDYLEDEVGTIQVASYYIVNDRSACFKIRLPLSQTYMVMNPIYIHALSLHPLSPQYPSPTTVYYIPRMVRDRVTVTPEVNTLRFSECSIKTQHKVRWYNPGGTGVYTPLEFWIHTSSASESRLLVKLPPFSLYQVVPIIFLQDVQSLVTIHDDGSYDTIPKDCWTSLTNPHEVISFPEDRVGYDSSHDEVFFLSRNVPCYIMD